MMKLIIYSRSNEREFGDHDKKKKKIRSIAKELSHYTDLCKTLTSCFQALSRSQRFQRYPDYAFNI